MTLRAASWAAGGIVVAVLLAAAGWGMTHPRTASTSALIGRPAPELVLRAFDGSTVSLVALRGRPVVVNFWASWCVPCRQENPSLQAAARAHSEVAFLGVDFQDSEAAARAYAAQAGGAYPVGEVAGGSVAAFGVTAPPETLFIDPAGRVAARFVGPVDGGVIDRYLQLVLA
ncbi:MAG TPA: TlpA disulfide reductase family protein, partial [Candidatus Dormibacteraeota bacterium]